jgi:hypothetical protein
MKRLSVSVSVFLIVIVTLLAQSQTATTAMLNYVTPTDGCSDDKTSCYTLKECVNQQATYFTNNSKFYFLHGLHKLEKDNNLSFHGVFGNEMVKNSFNSAASILWENCSDIEITSLVITLVDNFTYSIVFKHTHSVKMFNITVLGNQ